MKKNKRETQRAPIELAASFSIPEESLTLHNTKLLNISYGGFSFESGKKMSVGQKLQLAVKLSADQRTVLSVKIVWIKNNKGARTYTIGVKINNPSAEEYIKLAEFLSNKSE